jgi:DNA-binding response OmpR family regulator
MRSKWNPLAPIILVADDDPAMREFVAHVLTEAGYNVRVAMDIPRAIEWLHLPGVSAAVLDMLFVNSDGRSGLDVLRYIRTLPNLQQVPVLMVTGFPLNHSVVAEVQALRGELWHKPIDPAFLVQRLHDLLYDHPVTG